MRGAVAIALAAGLALAVALTASGAEPRARATATAQVVAGTTGTQGIARADGTDEGRYDGPVRTGTASVRHGDAVARTDATEPTALAAAAARTVSLLDGRVTAYGVRRVAEATAGGVRSRGRVEGLVVDGRRIGTLSSPETIPLSDGSGRVVVNRGATGLRVILTAASGDLPAGTDVQVAVASAAVRVPDPASDPKPTMTPEPTATAQRRRSSPAAKSRHGAGRGRREVERRPAPAVRQRLTRGGFAFPVYGEASFSDDFGAPRQPVIGTHQGTDVFAAFGAPVVAVTDGVVSKVGTLRISGNRLWLTSGSGDAFFYAHLSAFSPAAVDGRRVKAGTVLGFVGNTGDAEPTPPHVHFEIHPGGMDADAIDPYPILTAWQGRRDVPAGAWLREYGPDTTRRPGALVTVRDFIAE